MSNPHIMTELPGPKARALIARDAEVVSPSYPRDYPFVMSHGRGTEVWDVDGNRFLDFAGGHRRVLDRPRAPRVVEAIKDAADKFLHISSDYWHENMVALARAPRGGRPDGRAGDELPLPVRHRIGGGRAQARALRDRPAALHRLPRRLPRPHHGLARVHRRASTRSSRASRRRCPASRTCPYPNTYRPLFAGDDQGTGGARLHPHAVRAQRAAEGSRGDPGRADPGRRRLPRAARRLPRGPARALRRARHPAHLRRSAVRHRPHGQDVRREHWGVQAGHHDDRQGPRLGPADRRGRREEQHHGAVEARRARQHLRRQPRDAARPRSRRSTWWRTSSPPTRRASASTSCGACANCSATTPASARCAARAS